MNKFYYIFYICFVNKHQDIPIIWSYYIPELIVKREDNSNLYISLQPYHFFVMDLLGNPIELLGI